VRYLATTRSNSTRLPRPGKLWHLYFGTARVSDDRVLGVRKDCHWCLLWCVNQETSHSYQGKTEEICIKQGGASFTMIAHQHAHPVLLWLLFASVALNCCIIHHILRTWLYLTSMCSNLWKIHFNVQTFESDENVIHAINEWLVQRAGWNVLCRWCKSAWTVPDKMYCRWWRLYW